MISLDQSQPPYEDEVAFPSEDMSSTSSPSRETFENIPRTQFDIASGSEQNRTDSDIRYRLYVSHFLSTWNSRVFEFGAVLMLAHIYADTLLPASLYALVRAASAICLSPMVGRHVDREDRLKVLRRSIVGQRVAVILSCPGFWILGKASSLANGSGQILFSIMAVLACVEKLHSIMNLIAVERDWVIIIAENSQCELEVLNAQMRRIDLACKLLGPLIIALIEAKDSMLTIEVVLGMNVLFLLIEYFAIADVYRKVPALRSKQTPLTVSADPSPATQSTFSVRRLPGLCLIWARTIYKGLLEYSQHAASLPSFALCLLYLTVLSFSGQMVTYLLTAGITSSQIGLLRTISTAVEISATWLAPRAMSKVGPLRSGLWFINWQMACLCAAIAPFWFVDKSTVAASGLVAGTIASRVGLWGFDLCVQIIVQEVICPATPSHLHKLTFSSGSRDWLKRILFVPRIFDSELLRTLLLCLDYCLRSPRSVSVSCLGQCGGSSHLRRIVYSFCAEESRTFVAPL